MTKYESVFGSATIDTMRGFFALTDGYVLDFYIDLESIHEGKNIIGDMELMIKEDYFRKEWQNEYSIIKEFEESIKNIKLIDCDSIKQVFGKKNQILLIREDDYFYKMMNNLANVNILLGLKDKEFTEGSFKMVLEM